MKRTFSILSLVLLASVVFGQSSQWYQPYNPIRLTVRDSIVAPVVRVSTRIMLGTKAVLDTNGNRTLWRADTNKASANAWKFENKDTTAYSTHLSHTWDAAQTYTAASILNGGITIGTGGTPFLRLWINTDTLKLWVTGTETLKVVGTGNP